MENFIGEYDSVYSPELCEKWMTFFDDYSKLQLTRGQTEGIAKHKKDDKQIFLLNHISLPAISVIYQGFAERFMPKYDEYKDKYSVLNDVGNYGITWLKLQKTEVGGGYHMFHFENDTILNSRRIVTFMVYLNDVAEGGETEFLYYQKRYKPEQGKLLIWPSGYTHTHRGNPPLSGAKYILTGALEFL